MKSRVRRSLPLRVSKKKKARRVITHDSDAKPREHFAHEHTRATVSRVEIHPQTNHCQTPRVEPISPQITTKFDHADLVTRCSRTLVSWSQARASATSCGVRLARSVVMFFRQKNTRAKRVPFTLRRTLQDPFLYPFATLEMRLFSSAFRAFTLVSRKLYSTRKTSCRTRVLVIGFHVTTRHDDKRSRGSRLFIVGASERTDKRHTSRR